MDWLWTCLGGGGKHGVQPPRICAGKSPNSSSQGGGGGGGRGSTIQPHSLRLQQRSVPLPKNGHNLSSSDEAFQRRAVQSSYKCGEPESGDMIKIPVSSLSSTAACTSINSLRKASEGRTGRSSFLPDTGSSSLRSDVDELKEELAALRRRLAAEEEEAKRLREEVNYLRSCGVLHKPEDCYQARASKSLDREAILPQDCNSFFIYDDAAELRKQQSRDRSVKQFRRSFSGPLSWTGKANDMQRAQEKVSILRPVHSFKQQFNLHGIQDDQNIPPERSHNPTGEDGAAAAQTLGSRMALRTHASSLSHRNSRPPSSTWATHDKENSQALQVSKPHDLLLYEVPTSLEVKSADIQWIEVRDGPCPSASSTNVKLSPGNPPKDNAKSPHKLHMRMQSAEECGDTLPKDLQRTGKRRHRRASSNQEPIEKRAKDQSLKPAYHDAKLADGFEAQLLSAVELFNQQRQAQLSLTSSSTNNVGSLVFHTSRKRSVAFRSRGFRQPLSPVKEALSIEEASWSIKNESEQVSRNQEMPCTLRVSDSKRNQSYFEGSVNPPSPEKPEAETEKQLKGVFEANPLKQASSFTDKAAQLKPIQCVLPFPSPRKMSPSSSSPDILAALPSSSETSLSYPVVEQEELLSSVEGRLVDNGFASDDDGEVGMKPMKCASPTFTPKKKPSRSAVYQATEFKRHELPSLLNSADPVSRNQDLVPKSMDQVAASLPSSAVNSPHWTLSHENIDFHPSSNCSWHAHTAPVKTMDSTHDAQSIAQLQQPWSLPPNEKVLTVKQWQQQNVRPPQANSAEKKIAKRAFLSYVYDTNEQQQMKGSSQKECTTKKQQEEEIEQQQQQSIEEDTTPTTSLVMSRVQYWNSVHKSASTGRKREGKEGRTDSGETNSVSTTFSIDLGPSESSPINYESCSDVEGSADGYAVSLSSAQQPLALDVDLDATVKEDAMSRSCSDLEIPPCPRHTSVSQQQSAPSSGARKCNIMMLQNSSPKDRPILGAVAAAHWENVHLAQSPPQLWDGKGEPNLSHKYKEDQKVNWRGTPFEVRVDRALANQSDVSPRALFGVNTNPLVRSSLEMR
ncbi:unnamed protein product [Sphagnum balticum]